MKSHLTDASSARPRVAFVLLLAALSAAVLAFLPNVLASAALAPKSVTTGPAPSYGIWPDATVPAVPSSEDEQSVTLGLEFSSATAGRLRGVQYYAAGANRLATTGGLWNDAGRRIASVTFPTASTDGWKTAWLSSPVRIRAGEKYTVSYRAPNGHYATQADVFVGGRTLSENGLTAHRGTFTYGTGRPTEASRGSHYFVDVLFTPSSTTSTSTSTPTPTPTPEPTPTPTPTPTPEPTPEPTPTPTPTPEPTPTPTPEPTPTPTPTPTPSPSPSGANCMPNPSACGFPDVDNVGVLPGVARDAVSGNVTLSTDGQVYENKTLTGSIVVTGRNVTIRNVKILSNAPYYIISVRPGGNWDASDANLLVDHVEFDAQGEMEVKGIAFNGYTLRNSYFHDGSDCAHTGENVHIENNLCALGMDSDNDAWPDASFGCAEGPHYDGYQSDGGNNITIRHNTIRVPCGQTSAILMSTNTSSIGNVTVADNLMSGGGYTLYCDAGNNLFGTNSFTGNRFARTYFPRSGYWGPTTGCESYSFNGNVWDDTNGPVG